MWWLLYKHSLNLLILPSSKWEFVQKVNSTIKQRTVTPDSFHCGKLLPSLLEAAKPNQACAQEAWKYGLTSCEDDDWLMNLQAMETYRSRQGHVHVGFSSEDDPDLARFARMLRAGHRKGSLASERYLLRDDYASSRSAETSWILYYLLLLKLAICSCYKARRQWVYLKHCDE